mgnify:CR=1 FL=1
METKSEYKISKMVYNPTAHLSNSYNPHGIIPYKIILIATYV